MTITYQTGTLPVVTPPFTANVTAGSSISIQLQASGEPAPSFSETGPLPTGVSLSSSGVLSGTLSTGSAGSWPFSLTASNSVGSATETYALGVSEPSSYTGQTAVAAGTGAAGTSANGTPAASSELDDPSDVLVDSLGDRFVLNTASSTVDEIPATSTTAYGIEMSPGEIFDIAGNGVAGDGGDAGPGYLAKLDHPAAIAMDPSGDLFIADTGNDVVRVVAAKNGCLLGQQVSAGDIYTLIGTPGKSGYYGDGGPATSAKLDLPAGVALDTSGDVFVSDSGNDVVREVSSTTSCSVVPDIETIVGTGSPGTFTSGSLDSASPLDDPTSVAIGPDGNLYIDDASADLVAADALASGSVFGQSVGAGRLYAVAGNGIVGTSGNGGGSSSAELDDPGGIVLDAAGDLYLTDPAEGDLRVVAGSSTSSLFGIPTTTGDIYQLASGLSDPVGVGVDPRGAVYLAEGSAEEVGLLGTSPSITSGSSDSMQAGTASSFTFTASGEPLSGFAESGSLPSGVALSSAGVLSGIPAIGTAGAYSITVRASNGVGAVASQNFVLTVTPAATSLGMALIPSSPLVAATTTLTVTVSPTPDAGTTVSVSDAKGWFGCPAAAVSTLTGSATCTSSKLTSATSDQVSVRFNGDAQYAASNGALSVVPAPAPTTVQLSADPAVPSSLSTTTLTAKVSPDPDGGDVAFSDTDGYVSGCGSIAVNVVSGAASCTTASLGNPGADTFSATYLGDADYDASPTAQLPLTIGRAVTTLLVSTDPSPLVDASTGAIIATVSGPDGAVDGGTVGFSDTAGNIAAGSCSSQPVAVGAASCKVSSIVAAADTITAAYSGDTLYAPVTLNVGISPTTRTTTVKVSVSTSAFVVGEGSVLIATVDQQGATGTVDFDDTAGLVTGCSAVPLEVNGSATCATGAPATSGTDNVTVSYSGDADDAPSSTAVPVSIDAEPVITSPTSYSATAGQSFTGTIDTSGTPPVVAVTLDGGSLPPGLSLADGGNGTAVISGSIAADGGGVYTADVALNDGVLAPAISDLTITVDETPSFTTSSSATCVAGAACDVAVSADGYPSPNLSVAAPLPTGLSFADQGGGTALISGTPVASDVGTTSFTISADNGVGTEAVMHFTLAITPSPTPPSSGGSSGSSGGGSTSSGSGSASSTGSSSSNSSPSPPSRSPSVVLSSYVVLARLSGALRQQLSCPASTSDVHDNASSSGSITELGFDLQCKDGKIVASLSGSVTARHETTKVRTGGKTLTRITTVWEGGFSLRESQRDLTLTFSVSAAHVNRDLVVSATSSSMVLVKHTERAYHLELRIMPQYSTS